MLVRFRELMLFVEDPVEAAGWYAELLGVPLELLDGNPEYRFLRVGDAQIWFHRADGKSPVSRGGTVGYWEVADLDRALARAEGLGGRPYRGPLDREDGTWMAQVADPFGLVIGLIGPRPGWSPPAVLPP